MQSEKVSQAVSSQAGDGKATVKNSPALMLSQPGDDTVINISGHTQELRRQFDTFSVVATAITTGNVWIALAGTIAVAVYNGGPTGILYEFLVVSFFYWFVAASVTELASAMPTSGGVYHWATLTAGRYGKFIGFLGGWFNFYAWIFATAVTLQICSAIIITMAQLNSPSYNYQRWQVFVVFLVLTWACASIVLFLNRALPRLEQVGSFVLIAGYFITIIVAAVMPFVQGRSYASNHQVWNSFTNMTGYKHSSFAFVLGMLNGAFAVGVPDLTSHMAEEMQNPSRNIPIAVLFQYVVGFVTGVSYLIAIFYGLTDINSLFETRLAFPLGEIYRQVSGSNAGAIGLLFLVLFASMFAAVGCHFTASRMFWTLARDNATPFPKLFSHISLRYEVPFAAIVVCALCCTGLGCIYVGNLTAFNAFTSSFVVMSMASYLTAILPHLLRNRSKVVPGNFWMKGMIGVVVNSVACIFMLAFIVIFCFPFAMPVEVETMNYTCVIFGGLTIIMCVFYVIVRKEYEGPHINLAAGVPDLAIQEYRGTPAK